MIKASTSENLRIRDSVERTVEKLRFSRVRKYFWLREMVESCPEILKRDSSSPDMCSAGAASFVGISARSSFSTYYVGHQSGPELRLSMQGLGKAAWLGGWLALTAISKSTIFSAKVDMSLEKQNLYSPMSLAVKTKSPCRSLLPSRMIFWVGPYTT